MSANDPKRTCSLYKRLRRFHLTGHRFFDSKILEHKGANCRGQIVGLAGLTYPFDELIHRNPDRPARQHEPKPESVPTRHLGATMSFEAGQINRSRYVTPIFSDAHSLNND